MISLNFPGVNVLCIQTISPVRIQIATSYNNHNINEDNHIDTVDTNELHDILHQPSSHNIPNIKNQKEISNENHQNQVEEAESFTIDDDNLSGIYQNTEEEIIFGPDADEM